jgi:hypothetical protein
MTEDRTVSREQAIVTTLFNKVNEGDLEALSLLYGTLKQAGDPLVLFGYLCGRIRDTVQAAIDDGCTVDEIKAAFAETYSNEILDNPSAYLDRAIDIVAAECSAS